MDFRLATKLDLTPENCQQILSDAQVYCKENKKDTLTPYEILNIFINFSNGQVIDPQFWLILEEDKLVGYSITMKRYKDTHAELNIRQGYIAPAYRGNGVMGYCLAVLEEKAKKIGYRKISFDTFGNPKVYGRFVRRFGYDYRSTEYKKEI